MSINKIMNIKSIKSEEKILPVKSVLKYFFNSLASDINSFKSDIMEPMLITF